MVRGTWQISYRVRTKNGDKVGSLSRFHSEFSNPATVGDAGYTPRSTRGQRDVVMQEAKNDAIMR